MPYKIISEDGEVQRSVYYNKDAEYIIKQYCQKLRTRKILGILLTCMDAIMFYIFMKVLIYTSWVILILPIYLMSLFLVCLSKCFFDFKSFYSLSTILHYDCDPGKYQEVLKRLEVLDKRGEAQATISLELAAAALAQGKREESAIYLEQVTFKKFVLFRELKKLSCYADYCDLYDDFIGLHQIKEELNRLKVDLMVHSYSYKKIEYQISLVEAMAAREYESIDKQGKRWAMLYSMADTPLQENLYLMRLARLELAQGKGKLAIRHLGYVAAEGNALPCVEEAIQILGFYEMESRKSMLDT